MEMFLMYLSFGTYCKNVYARVFPYVKIHHVSELGKSRVQAYDYLYS